MMHASTCDWYRCCRAATRRDQNRHTLCTKRRETPVTCLVARAATNQRPPASASLALARSLPSSTAQAWLVCSTFSTLLPLLSFQKGSSQTRTSHPPSAQLPPLTEASLPFSTALSNFSKPEQLAPRSSLVARSNSPQWYVFLHPFEPPRAPLTIAGPLRLCPHRGRQPREVYV
jgi:hypothetical protein